MNDNKSAREIVETQIRSWGEGREMFLVDTGEIKILIHAGATRVVENRDNGDGTFYNEVLFEGKKFASSSQEKG